MNTKIIAHRTQVNPELLQHGEASFTESLDTFKKGTVTDVLPKGKLLGMYYLSYVKELDAWSAIDYKKATDPDGTAPKDKAFVCSHTNVRIEDTRSHLITIPTDIQDFSRKNWNAKGYKEIDFDFNENEQIVINYDAVGDAYPLCGEFVFIIEETIVCN